MIGLVQPIEISKLPREHERPIVDKAQVPIGAPIVGVGVQIENRPTPATTVIGVICAGDLATHRDTVKQALKRGVEQRPDSVWVCIELKSDRLTHDLMISLGIEPVILPLNPAWKRNPFEVVCADSHGHYEIGDTHPGYDFRRVWRDLEMLTLCDELIVFHRRSGNSPWRDRAASGLYTDRLVVVEIGKPKVKK